MLKKTRLIRGKRGPDVSGKPYKVCGLMTTGIAVTGGLQLNTSYKLTSVADAVALGINAAYDLTASNNMVIYQHIVDFYDEAGEGSILWLRVAAQATTLATMIDDSSAVHAKKLIIDAGGAIYNLGIGFNPAVGYTETLVDALNADVRAAIAKAQALYQWSVDSLREVYIALECRGLSATPSSAADLRALPASPSGLEQDDAVSLVIGQDFDFASTLTGLPQKYAGIGKYLGTISACELQQDPGEVASFNLTRETAQPVGRWKNAGLSNHIANVAQEAVLTTLDTKGYVFADIHPETSGYRWNGDATCTPIIVDENDNMNEHKATYKRTMNHATRLLRKTLTQEIRKTIPADPTTGKMTVGINKYLKSKGDDVFADMKNDGQISGGETFVDMESDIFVAKEVDYDFNLVPLGTIATINGNVNLKIRL